MGFYGTSSGFGNIFFENLGGTEKNQSLFRAGFESGKLLPVLPAARLTNRQLLCSGCIKKAVSTLVAAKELQDLNLQQIFALPGPQMGLGCRVYGLGFRV